MPVTCIFACILRIHNQYLNTILLFLFLLPLVILKSIGGETMAKRDNFTEKTKRIAAEKVAYFCSNPKCRRPTVGPNEDGKVHHYGEAAHIYAATIYGPRGDASMSEKELTSEENCLWLCNNCHELIDANPRSYSPELLKDWKKIAEKRAFDFVSNPDNARKIIDEIERNSGLAKYFDELFDRGDFVKISNAIYELNKRDNLNEHDKEELIFAQFRLNAFCARSNLKENLKWIKTAPQNIKERGVDFSISCFDEELCDAIKLLSNNELKRELASMIAGHIEITEFSKWCGENASKIDNKQMLNSAFVIGCVKNGKTLTDNNYKHVSYRGGWLLNTFDTVSFFIFDGMSNKKGNEKTQQFFLDNIETFTWLDEYYINYIFDKNFAYFPKGEILAKIFYRLIQDGVSTSSLRINYFFSTLSEGKRYDSMDEAIKLGIKYQDNRLLAYALTIIAKENPEKAISFIDNKFNYLCNDLLFFDPYSVAKNNLGQEFDKLDFLLNKYVGVKDANYYLLCSHSYFLKGDNLAFVENWNKYLQCDIDYDGEYILMAIEIAFEINDESFIKNFCEQSMNASALFFTASKLIVKKMGLDIVAIMIDRMESMRGRLPNTYNETLFNLYLLAQRFNEAIECGKKAYFEDNSKLIASYVIQLMIQLAKYEENDFIDDVKNNSIDPPSLNLLGQYYLKMGKTRMGWDYLARSVSLLNEQDNTSYYGLFIDCELIDNKSESDDYTYVATEEGECFILLPKEERKYFRDELFGIPIFYTDEANELLFLKVGDCFFLNGKKLTVRAVVDYFYYFYNLALKKILLNPSSIAIEGKSAKEIIDKMADILKKSKDEFDKFIESTNGQPLPFFPFQKAVGRSVIETIEILYFSDKRNSFFVPMQKSSKDKKDIQNGFVFDVEMIYLAYKLGITKETVKKDKCKITPLTKGAILNEILEKENSCKGPKEKSSIGIDKANKGIALSTTNNEIRRNLLKELNQFKQFVNSFIVTSSITNADTEDQGSVLQFFSEHKDYIDAEVLKCLWNGELFVSNNMIIHMAKQFGKGDVLDFSRYISLSSCPSLEAIKVVKNMKTTNIREYITPDVFNSIMTKITNIENKDDREESIKAMIELIKGNWNNEWSEDDIKFHKLILYVASIDERGNFNEPDIIHQLLKDNFNELLRNYISGKPLI